MLALLCVSLEAGRMFYTGSLSYVFLIWNLFLAMIPYVLSSSIQSTKPTGAYLFGTCLLWLLFLPNALYIITDLKHLRVRPPIPEWFDCLLLFSFSTLALLFGLISFYQMHQVFKKHLPAFIQPIILMSISFLAGFGVYLGREERWNSWDLFTHPLGLLSECLTLSMQTQVWVFSLCYGFAFLSMYYILSGLIHYRHETSGQLV